MRCDGHLLMPAVRRQMYDEEESLKTWKLPLKIVLPLVIGGILCLTAFAIRQRVQYLRMLDRDDWNINFFEIDFIVQRFVGWLVGNLTAP